MSHHHSIGQWSSIVIGSCWFGGVWYHVLSELTLWFTILDELPKLFAMLSWSKALWVASLVIFPCISIDGCLEQIL